MEVLLEMDELLHLTFHELGDRYTGPSAHDISNILLVDLLLQHLEVGLEVIEHVLALRQLLVQRRQCRISKLCCLLEVAIALSPLSLAPGLLDLLLGGADL